MKQPKYILPVGTRIITHDELFNKPEFGLTATLHGLVVARKQGAKGSIWGVVGGAGGDLYWVDHEDGTRASYCFTEFELDTSEMPSRFDHEEVL